MRYELKKLLLRKELWVVLLLALLGAALAVYGGRDDIVPEMTAPYREKTAQYLHIPMDEAEELLAAELEELAGEAEGSPRWYERCVLERFDSDIAQYARRDAEIAQMLDEIAAYAKGSDYAERDAALAARLYGRPVQDMLCDRGALEQALSETGGSSLGGHAALIAAGVYLLLVCVLTAPLFACEHESGMYQILYAAQRGRAGLFRRKICCGMLAVAVLTAAFTVGLYAAEWLRCGLSLPVLSAPVQSTELLAKCPYLLKVWQYILLHFILYLLCGWLVLSVSAVLAGLCRTSLGVFAGTAGVSAMMLLPPVLLNGRPGVLRLAKQLGTLRLMFPNEYLTQYESVDLRGFPVPQLLLSAAGTVLLCAFLMTAAYAVCTKKGR